MRKWDRDPALLSDYGYLQGRAQPPSMLGSGLASGLIDVRLLCKACLGLFRGGQRSFPPLDLFTGNGLISRYNRAMEMRVAPSEQTPPNSPFEEDLALYMHRF